MFLDDNWKYIAAAIVAGILWLSVVGGVVYTIAHFAIKYW